MQTGFYSLITPTPYLCIPLNSRFIRYFKHTTDHPSRVLLSLFRFFEEPSPTWIYHIFCSFRRSFLKRHLQVSWLWEATELPKGKVPMAFHSPPKKVGDPQIDFFVPPVNWYVWSIAVSRLIRMRYCSRCVEIYFSIYFSFFCEVILSILLIKREIRGIHKYGGRCYERLKAKTGGSKSLAHTSGAGEGDTYGEGRR